ncbi:MAG: hypothetical protein JJV98_18095 [Desulfosarcina sp.]|nr:hypothetical protein [Desulfobacterales bacterium]
MIEKVTLYPNRIRKITGSFAFVEHRFLRDGFFQSLTHHELLLYLFLVLAGDRKGLSYYSYDKICTLLRISVDEYLPARNTLIDKDLIAFDGRLFQVLSLPQHPAMSPARPLKAKSEMEKHGLAAINSLIARSLKEVDHGL